MKLAIITATYPQPFVRWFALCEHDDDFIDEELIDWLCNEVNHYREPDEVVSIQNDSVMGSIAHVYNKDDEIAGLTISLIEVD